MATPSVGLIVLLAVIAIIMLVIVVCSCMPILNNDAENERRQRLDVERNQISVIAKPLSDRRQRQQRTEDTTAPSSSHDTYGPPAIAIDDMEYYGGHHGGHHDGHDGGHHSGYDAGGGGHDGGHHGGYDGGGHDGGGYDGGGYDGGGGCDGGGGGGFD